MPPSRNDPCPCGSGKKYKKCCGRQSSPDPVSAGDPVRQAFLLLQQGRLQAAGDACRAALTRDPDDAPANHLYGLILYQADQSAQAQPFLEKAVTLAPRDATARSNLALVLHRLGRLDEAEARCREALALDAVSADAHNTLGTVLEAGGRLDEALSHYRQAATLNPRSAQIQCNIGSALQRLRRPLEAESAYRTALALAPGFAPAHMNLGMLYRQERRLDEALAALRAAASLSPDDAVVLNNLGSLLQQKREYAQAVACFRRALASAPDFAGAWLNLGLTCEAQDERGAAVEAYARALATDPKLTAAAANLMMALEASGRLDEAHALACRVLDDPALHVAALPQALDVFLHSCDGERANRALRLAIEHALIESAPADQLAHLLPYTNYTDSLTRDEIFELHRRWGESVATPASAPAARAGGGRLRVGYLSGDFRAHSVGYFFRPIVAHHDKTVFEIHCYSNSRQEDELTRFIAGHADHFVRVRDLDDAELAERIRSDGIDILVDLSGHTAGTRLPVLTRRPAPVQVAYLGYPNTTGLAAVDYRITDPYADIADGTRYTERLLALPESFLCFGAFLARPIAAVAPQRRNGFFTFGSFNNLAKLSASTVRAWSAILARVPDSRLLLKAHGAADPRVQANLRRAFADAGVDGARLLFRAATATAADHLDAYNDIDLALDTFPYNGTTTTCEALWMGVPVLTLVGRQHRQRVSCSILRNLGRDDLCTWDEAGYVETATRLAGDGAALAGLRGTIAGGVRDSILCRPERFVRQLEQAYRQAWSGVT